ncbi:hypothetical protein [Mesorhizobium sp. M0965]|uniref:hypothetical protein n=1 Tax=unclassified Mesorhizobium TaxID=325217 RepID=UPI0033367655
MVEPGSDKPAQWLPLNCLGPIRGFHQGQRQRRLAMRARSPVFATAFVFAQRDDLFFPLVGNLARPPIQMRSRRHWSSRRMTWVLIRSTASRIAALASSREKKVWLRSRPRMQLSETDATFDLGFLSSPGLQLVLTLKRV